MKTIKEVFAENLKKLRGNRTQAEIAEAAEIPFRSYQNMETGAIPKESSGNLSAVAQVFGVPETRLFQDDSLIAEDTSLNRFVNIWSNLNESERNSLLNLAQSLADAKSAHKALDPVTKDDKAST